MKFYITSPLLSILVLSLSLGCSKDSGGGGTIPPDGSGGGGTPTPTEATPGKAGLEAPANNKACEEVNGSGQVQFSWASAADSKSYDLKITNLNTQAVTNQTNIAATSKAVTLEKGIPYSWQVTSKNVTKTTLSDTWKFYLAGDGIVNYAPFPAAIDLPTSGSTVTPTNGKVALSWTGSDADDTILTYDVEVDTQDGLQGNKEIENTSDNSFELSVAPNTVYYWRVICSDGQNTSTSIVYTFITSS